MSYEILNLPVDAKEINEFIDVFRLKEDMEEYRNQIVQKMKEHWGDEFGAGGGYIDAAIDVVKDGKIVYPFKKLSNEKLEAYLAQKVGDFFLCARLSNTVPFEYEIDFPYNIGTIESEFFGKINLIFDGSFNVTSAVFSYETGKKANKYLTYWVLKYSD